MSALELLQRYLEHPALKKSIAGPVGQAMHGQLVRELPKEPPGARLAFATVAIATWSAILAEGSVSPDVRRAEVEDILVLACEAYLAAKAEARLS